MTIIAKGIDLAKNVLALHGVSAGGAVKLAPAEGGARQAQRVDCSAAAWGYRHGGVLWRAPPGPSVSGLRPYGAAESGQAGFAVPQSGKRANYNAADAAARYESLPRPNLRFVAIDTEGQQAQLVVHRARLGFITARTACINRIRGLLNEFGIVLPLKAEVGRRTARAHLEDLPG